MEADRSTARSTQVTEGMLVPALVAVIGDAMTDACARWALADAERPFVDLLRAEVTAAIEAGLLNPPDPEWDSWFLAELTRWVYHFYAFAPHATKDLDVVKDQLWRFWLAELGGTAKS